MYPVTTHLWLKSEVHYVCKTRIKEMTAPEDVIKVLESYFSERGKSLSRRSSLSRRFSLKKMNDEIKHKEDGHYEMSAF